MKQKILIVDDEPINLDFFDVMLSKLGFIVEKAEDGEQALERVKEVEPDLILLDNIMPKLSGWEVTKILKNHEDYSDYHSIPIIMFSAMNDVKDKIQGFELGVEDYITKPFNFSEVLARIRAVLRHYELSKQVVEKERYLAAVESLNQSLIYFTTHLREPVLELLKKAQQMDEAPKEEVKSFIEEVRSESEKTIAALDGLEEEIRELKGAEFDSSKAADRLKDLEKKFDKHIKNMKDRETSLNGVEN
ncbi:MAG: response regulator [Spirochaetales bacterium]|nr:response regulator [Spirochaetales bacterium]MCF7937039.1 response regulator [Spirochaetales bacterium]